IDHVALNALLLQNAVDPEAIKARLLDRDDRIGLAGPGLCLALKLRKQLQKPRNIASRDAVFGHFLALAGRQRSYQPIRTAQFQRQKIAPNCVWIAAGPSEG